MTDAWQTEFVTLSCPHGLVEVGWRFVRKNQTSNILCLACAEQKRLYFAETRKSFARHLVEAHPELAHFVRLRNYHKMIV